jgi:hypothetical protein
MKKLNFIIKYGLALLLLSFYSCESWLNVTPSDRLSEEMLFNDREGFVKALNGVYIEWPKPDCRCFGCDGTVLQCCFFVACFL